MLNKNGFSRRDFIKRTAIVGAALTLPWKFAKSAYAANASPCLKKWIQPIRGLGPTGIPVLSGVPDPVLPNTLFYDITVGEFQDVLHPDLGGPTTLWGYWDTKNPVKHHLGGVIVAQRGTASRLRFTNKLPPDHILPVDASNFFPDAASHKNKIATHLHGGFIPWMCDGGPYDWFTPEGISGPSFINGPRGVLDNIPWNRMKPGQADYFYPNDQSSRLMWYHDHAHDLTRLNAYAGIASAYLMLDGINSAYIKAGKIPDLASTIPLVFQDKSFVNKTTLLNDPTWYDIMKPAVQANGSLWYEHIYNPADVQQPPGFTPQPLPELSCVPEFFGDTMLANGTVYPLCTVEAKRYRFLLLNACNARVMNLNLFKANPANRDGIDLCVGTQFPTNPPGPNMIQVANEAGFLAREVVFVSPKQVGSDAFGSPTGNLILAPAERADLIIDFTGHAGKEFILYNDAAAPFPRESGDPANDYYLGNPNNLVQPTAGTGPDTRQVLRIKVVDATTNDPQPGGQILDPQLLDPAPIVPVATVANVAYDCPATAVPPLPIPTGVPVRKLTLNEGFDAWGRLTQTLGTDAPTDNTTGDGFGMALDDPPTEVVNAGATEVWQLFNRTGDTHPIHFHLGNLQILSRANFDPTTPPFAPIAGTERGPDRNELGWKETIRINPGEVLTAITKFDLPAVPFVEPSSPRMDTIASSGAPGSLAGMPKPYHEYVYHCHILEHEEHDMMRPLVVAGSPLEVTLVQETTVPPRGKPQVIKFFASGGQAPYSVTNIRNTTLPSPGRPCLPLLGAGLIPVPGLRGFEVIVTALTKPGIYEFTVQDRSRPRQTATAVLRVWPA